MLLNVLKRLNTKSIDTQLCVTFDFGSVFHAELEDTKVTSVMHFLCPPNRRGGIYCFWCGSRRRRHRRPHCFVSVRYLLNRWTDFDQTCTDTLLGGRNELIRFWRPHCFVSVRYLLNLWTDFDQTCTDTLLGGWNELIRFW